MSKKPRKTEETASPYPARKRVKATRSTKPGSSPANDAAFKRITEKIFFERKELLRKLAQ